MPVVGSWRPRFGRGKAWPPEGELCGSQCNQCGDPEGREEGDFPQEFPSLGRQQDDFSTDMMSRHSENNRQSMAPNSRQGWVWMRMLKSKGWAVSERLGTGCVWGVPCQHSATRKLLQGDWCPSSPMSCSSSLPSLPSSLPFFFITKSDYVNHGISVAFLS